MSITSLKNRIQKRVELEKYKSDFSDIGNFIKRKRKELQLTQDEISTGICSISYLSKIENNQIVPNTLYVKEIMQRLKVEDEIYSKSIQDKNYIDRTIKAFFYQDEESIIQLYDEIKDIEHNVIINLCKLGYTVFLEKDDENQYVMMLEHLTSNMTNMELKLYLYFSTLFFMQHERYKIALELIVLSSKVKADNEMLTAMFYEVSYYVKQRLLVKNCSSEDYFNAVSIYTKRHNTSRLIHLALVKANFLSKENPHKALTILETIKTKFLTSKLLDFYYITLSEVHFHLKNYKNASLSLKEIDETSTMYVKKMILLLQICKEENDIDTIENIKEIMTTYKPKKTELRNKICYHYLIQDTTMDQKDYLRDIAIPFSIKIEDYDQLCFYVQSMIQICEETSRYKEGIQYYKKYQKELEKVKRILY